MLHLLTHGAAALWADPGAGKTSITLTAFAALQRAGSAKKMLVIAPLRVCQLVWRQEGAKWKHLRHLKFALLHGKDKGAALREDADVYLINYEGIPWLAKKFAAYPMPFDTVVADELTKLKKSNGERFKALFKLTQRTQRKWGLTGTPAPNGYLDLHGQFLFLDSGAALGRWFSKFRDQYFKPDYDGFNYVIQKDGEERIHNAIDHMVFRLSYTNLPPVRDNPILIQLTKPQMAAYKAMKNDALLETVDGQVTAGNAAAVYSKLKQMANGAVYLSGVVARGPRPWTLLHDAKIDALRELIEELDGKPLLVAYQYHHDLERLQAAFPDAEYIGAGTSEEDAIRIQYQWNSNRINLLLCQPQSVGHGLNFQEGGAGHLCWFSTDFNLEYYEQFIRRIRRQGNDAERIVNHQLIVEGTIDEDVYAALEGKDTTQARLLQAVARVISDTPVIRVGMAQSETKHMPIQRLPAQGGAAPAGPVVRRTVQGPGAGYGAGAPQATAPQGAAIQAKISRSPAPQQAPQPQQQPPAVVRRPTSPAPAAFDPIAAAAAMFQGGMDDPGSHAYQEQGQQQEYVEPQYIQQDEYVREDGQANVDNRLPAYVEEANVLVAAEETKPKRARGPRGQTAPSATQDDPNRFAPQAEQSPAVVTIHFHGTPASVATAMIDFINAMKAA